MGECVDGEWEMKKIQSFSCSVFHFFPPRERMKHYVANVKPAKQYNDMKTELGAGRMDPFVIIIAK